MTSVHVWCAPACWSCHAQHPFILGFVGKITFFEGVSVWGSVCLCMSVRACES